MEVIGIKLKIRNAPSFTQNHFHMMKCMLTPYTPNFGGESRGDNYASSDDISLQYHKHIEADNVLTIGE